LSGNSRCLSLSSWLAACPLSAYSFKAEFAMVSDKNTEQYFVLLIPKPKQSEIQHGYHFPSFNLLEFDGI
jgi:hypothetical protein